MLQSLPVASCRCGPRFVKMATAPARMPHARRLHSSGQQRLSAASHRLKAGAAWQRQPKRGRGAGLRVCSSQDEVLRSLSENGEVSVMVAVGRELVQEVRSAKALQPWLWLPLLVCLAGSLGPM